MGSIFFKKIRWKNLLSTGNVFTEVDLSGCKSNLIVGENGAGKTTLLVALSFVNFGKSYRNINLPQLVNTINKQDMVVEEELTVGENEYFIRRGLSPSIFEIYKNGVLVDQSGSREYQKYLELSVLKMNYKSFLQLVVLGSTSYVPFMKLTPYDRRIIIENLLDIEVFSVMNNILKNRATSLNNMITEKEISIKHAENVLELNRKHLREMEKNIDKLVQQNSNKILEYNSSIKELEENIQELNKQLVVYKEELKQISNTKKIFGEIQNIKSGLDSKKKKIGSENLFFTSNAVCPRCTQSITEDFRKGVLEKNSGIIKTVENGLMELSKKEDKVNETLRTLSLKEEECHNKEKLLSNLQIKKKTFKSFIVDLEKDTEKLKNTTPSTNLDEVKKNEENIRILNRERENLNNQLYYYSILENILKDNGIKSQIIKRYIPIFNRYINKYLGLMDFSCSFQLNENFEETIQSRFRDVFSYESFSEGEKLRIDLALLFTWRSVCKLRNSVSCNILIMD